MNYWKGISIKAIAIGFLGGYCAPYILLEIFSYILHTVGINQLFGFIPLLIVVLMSVIAPMTSGYLGARHSNVLPVANGILATLIGVSAFIVLRKIENLYIFLALIILAILFGYIGAKRYMLHG